MSDSYGFVVCARIPAPRSQHGWTYEPISAVAFELHRVENCFDSVRDPRRKRPAHPGADGYVLCELVPVSLGKPAWPVLAEPVNARDRVVNERLADIINLDEKVGV